MADNRYNQVPGFGFGGGGGGGFQVGPQNASMHGVPGMTPYMQTGMPMNPMMQQQMMMAPGMRFPMQGMRMGPPNTPPPPYTVHSPNPGVTSIPNRPRTSLNKTKGSQKSEKERFFEEQRQKLKQFGKPGAAKVDADKLIGSMFSADTRTQQAKAKAQTAQVPPLVEDDDDGFGDFLQGPSVPHSNKPNTAELTETKENLEPEPEPEPEPQEEKKDLTSMMMEFSDLSAPKKAKGFHKPTLNEVQKSHPGHHHHHHKATSFHESDHSRHWKANTQDLEGLFQLPAQAKQPQPSAVPAQSHHSTAQYPAHMMVSGVPASSVPGYPAGSVPLAPPAGPPPAYFDVAASSSVPPGQTTMVASNYVSTPVNHPSAGDHSPVGKGPVHLPEWCTHDEEQVPPVYKQVWEASLVDNKIATERLYPILILSGLPREKLAQIWSMCNTATPGQLNKNELWLILALIALTQNQYETNSLHILARCPVAPVPMLAHKQDPSSPATLPTTPQQHVAPTMHHPAPSATPPTSATPPYMATATNTPHQQPQQHRVQHPRPQQPAAASATLPSTEDDDFADFQAAAPSSNTSTLSANKNEAFGEFIGGGNLGKNSFGHTPPPPSFSAHSHMGNGSVVMGNGSHRTFHQQQLQQQQQQQQQQRQQQQQEEPAQLSLSSFPVDDKYGTNVRSFFCSSDSSTGHTSPSFEDDDFTDGRDSLSQVSTSEQSENEDIRNFENYVEEFNQKKERIDGSPLHCPFPTVPQGQAMKSSKGQVQPTNDPRSSQGNFPSGFSQNSGSSMASTSAKSDFSDFKTASSVSSSIPTIVPPGSSRDGAGGGGEDDFADFKSASFDAQSAANGSSAKDVNLIGDEDKYGALRVLTLDSDFTQPSLFEGKDPALASSNNTKPASDIGGDGANDEDEWADFSAAEVNVGGAENQDTFSAAASGVSVPGSGLNKSGNKEDILKLFNSPMKGAATLISGNSSDVTSEGGSKSGSIFGDDPSISSTPSKSRGLDSSMSGDHLSYSSLNEQDSTIVGSGWDKNDTGPSDDWASFAGAGSDTRGDLHKQGSSGATLSLSSSGASMGSSFPTSVQEDWGKFSHNTSSGSGNVLQNPLSGGDGDNWGDFSHTTSSADAGKDEDDWCEFSSVGSSAGAKDKEEAGDGANFVTIKKQNLGTNEIMGLFKVRDDPATLSSYQLPPQPAASKTANRHSSRSSHGRRISSDFDDDMGPPPMDFGHDDDYDDHTFSRGYDLDDFMQRGPPATTYSPFGVTHTGHMYSRAGGNMSKVKESKEDSGSVHSLDLPSTRHTDPSGSDSQSVSSADLTSGDMAGTGGHGVTSVESKSLDSLDLKTDVGEGENSDGVRDENAAPPTTTPHHHPIQPQELLDSMPDFADKYNIEREAQGSDRYGHEWERCLSNCFRIISEANTLFNTISSSSVCNEVLKSSQGSEYVTSVIEIYRVVCRVMTSMRSTAISTTELEQTLKNIDLAWNNLTAFLVGACLLPDQTSLVFTNSVLKSDSDQAQSLACGLCLLNVNIKPPLTTPSSNDIGAANSCKLTYAGRQYHATCANFWVNCVDQTLPSLSLPELL